MLLSATVQQLDQRQQLCTADQTTVRHHNRLPGELLQVPRKVAMFLHAHTNMSEETTEPVDQPGGFALINNPY